MVIQDRLLTPNPYSRPQTELKEVKNIVVHYVGNASSTAEANRNYFNSLKDKKSTYASSHYIIGLEGEILRCVPDNEIAYHAKSANTNSIGIECCHPDWGGEFNAKTFKSLMELCIELCKKYKLNPTTDIIRHYDEPSSNKKKCPLYYVEHPDEWIMFRSRVKDNMQSIDKEYKEAVEVLVDKGIIGSPTAWFPLEKVNIKNVPSLIKKVARYINK